MDNICHPLHFVGRDPVSPAESDQLNVGAVVSRLEEGVAVLSDVADRLRNIQVRMTGDVPAENNLTAAQLNNPRAASSLAPGCVYARLEGVSRSMNTIADRISDSLGRF